MQSIKIATSIQEISDCFPVMQELRSSLDLDSFISQVQRQQQQLTLDSGVQRFAAHRLYLRQRMDITSHHFTMNLKSATN